MYFKLLSVKVSSAIFDLAIKIFRYRQDVLRCTVVQLVLRVREEGGGVHSLLCKE